MQRGMVATHPHRFPLLGGEGGNWSKATPTAAHSTNEMNGMLTEQMLDISPSTHVCIHHHYVT